jgi:hypothetical protein
MMMRAFGKNNIEDVKYKVDFIDGNEYCGLNGVDLG